jgi:hypothetical protein
MYHCRCKAITHGIEAMEDFGGELTVKSDDPQSCLESVEALAPTDRTVGPDVNTGNLFDAEPKNGS